MKESLSNFIVAYEIFHWMRILKQMNVLLIQAIQLRWNEFYNLLMISDTKFLKELSRYSQMDEDARLNILGSEEVKEDDEKNYVLRTRKLLSNFKTDFELWNFLRKHFDTLINISDLTIYRRCIEVGIKPTAQTTDKNQEAYELLRIGDISAFNRRAKEIGILNLSRASLSGFDLIDANLSKGNLRRAKLVEAHFSRADLRRKHICATW